jgi:hypothetical protein
MKDYADMIRKVAAQTHEVRRTGSRDLSTALIRDLFIIAEGLERAEPAEDTLQRLLKNFTGLNALNTGRKDRHCGFIATFQGQAWFMDNAIPVDDSRHTYLVTDEEVVEAHDGFGVYDDLHIAERAPAEVRDWSGPFEIDLRRRRYRITGCAALDQYADDLAGVRAILAAEEPEHAGLANAILLKDDADMGDPDLTGVVGQFFADNRRWDIIVQDADVDPETLDKAA